MDTVISTSKTLIGIWAWNIFSVCFESPKEQICFVIYTKFLPSHLGFFAFKGKISYFWAFLKAVFYPSLFFFFEDCFGRDWVFAPTIYNPFCLQDGS